MDRVQKGAVLSSIGEKSPVKFTTGDDASVPASCVNGPPEPPVTAGEDKIMLSDFKYKKNLSLFLVCGSLLFYSQLIQVLLHG